MSIQSIIESLRAASNPSDQIPIVNRSLDTIARAIVTTGQSANQSFTGHGIVLPLPMVDTIDEAIAAMPAPRKRDPLSRPDDDRRDD